MAHILNTVMGSATVAGQVQDEQGNVSQVEKTVPIVKEVTFMLDRFTPHTLRFLDKGTELVDGRGVKRVVGDMNTPYHEFSTAEDAVAAYLDGKL